MIKNLLNNLKNEDYLASVISMALFTAVFAGAWDVWWHGFLGRESFWSPPHLLLYTASIIAILSGLYGWKSQNNVIWKWIGIVLLLVPFSAPFDELWHRSFGVEEISSVLVLWSPPHVVLILGITTALILLLKVLKRNKDITKQRFFSALSLGALFSLFTTLVLPFNPIGPWMIAGFWGAGIVTVPLIAVLSWARKQIPGMAPATLTAFFLIALVSIGFSEGTVSPDIDFPPHPHAPGWLILFSVFLPALWLDLRKSNGVVSIAIAGGISGGVLYGFAPYFIEPAFRYGSAGILVALLASILGGLVAGIIIKQITKKK